MNRFIAVQTGARRNYAVPLILEKAGMLDTFYTDVCANSGLGKILERFCPQFFQKGMISRLLNRRLSPQLAEKVHTCDWAALRYLTRQKLAGRDQIKQHQALSAFNQEFGQEMASQGIGGATHIFSMFGEGTNFLEYAKHKGVQITTEIYISPLTYDIIQKEKNLFPDLETPMPNAIVESGTQWFKKVCQLTDTFIVPSQFVAQGLAEFGVDSVRCKQIPYAVNSSWLELQNQPQKGRILFVGTAELRKGIHTLGMAAEQLQQRNYDFRVAGGVTDKVRQHKITQKLNFLGRVPRANIQQEYTQADIFVLPTLAEGSAEVIYEALAVGLPVITTEAAGSVIRDGIEGFIIPERDSEALANRIEELVENRFLRDRLAQAAKERAKDYTWDKYSERLLSVFQTV